MTPNLITGEENFADNNEFDFNLGDQDPGKKLDNFFNPDPNNPVNKDDEDEIITDEPGKENNDLITKALLKSSGKEVDEDEDNKKDKSTKARIAVDDQEGQELTAEEEKEKGDKGRKTVKAENNPIQIVAEALAEKGLIDLPADLKDFDEDKFFESFENTLEERVNAEVDAFANKLGEEGKALIKHLQSGGSVSEFVKLADNPIENLDLTQPEGQKAIMREYLKSTTRMNSKKIDEYVDDLEVKGTLEQDSKEAYKDYNSIIKERNDQALQAKDEAKKTAEKEKQEIAASLLKRIDDLKDVKGFPIGTTPKEKQRIKDYLTKPAIVLKDGRRVTQYYADQLKESNDIDAYILRAVLTMNKYDMKPIKAAAKTQVTNSLTDKLRRANPALRNNGQDDISLEGSKPNNKSWNSLL